MYLIIGLFSNQHLFLYSVYYDTSIAKNTKILNDYYFFITLINGYSNITK